MVFMSDPESGLGGDTVLVGWLALTDGWRLVAFLNGVGDDGCLAVTLSTGTGPSTDLVALVLGRDARVLTLLADFESLSSLFSSSTITSTVTGFAGAGFGFPAFLSVKGGLGGPLLMILFRLANFSFDALMSVDGGENRSAPGPGAVLSLLCSLEKEGYAALGRESAGLVEACSSMTAGIDERLREPDDDRDVFEAAGSLVEVDRCVGVVRRLLSWSLRSDRSRAPRDSSFLLSFLSVRSGLLSRGRVGILNVPHGAHQARRRLTRAGMAGSTSSLCSPNGRANPWRVKGGTRSAAERRMQVPMWDSLAGAKRASTVARI